MANTTSAVRLLLLFLCFTVIIALRNSSKFVSDGSDFVITGADTFSETFITRTRRATVVNKNCIKYEKTKKELRDYKDVLDQELKANSLFSSGWERAKLLQIRRKSLSEEEALSLTTYTLNGPRVYEKFNSQSRELGPNNPKFQFKAMYYFLTMAVDILSAKSLKRNPYKVYRGVSYNVSANVGDAFNFVNFASSSFEKAKALNFLRGKDVKYLLTIEETLLGANISYYSAYPNEKEVLIPPCENFRVANKTVDNNWGIVYVDLVRSFGQKRCTQASGLVMIMIGIVGLLNI